MAEKQSELLEIKNDKAIKNMIPGQNHDYIDHMKDKLDRALAQNNELKKDLVSAQRIQIEQSKALEKITNENEFP